MLTQDLCDRYDPLAWQSTVLLIEPHRAPGKQSEMLLYFGGHGASIANLLGVHDVKNIHIRKYAMTIKKPGP